MLICQKHSQLCISKAHYLQAKPQYAHVKHTPAQIVLTHKNIPTVREDDLYTTYSVVCQLTTRYSVISEFYSSLRIGFS